MTDVAISIKNLGKCYRIYDSPRDKLKEVLTFGRRKYHREFWALRCVTLDVVKTQILGVLGCESVDMNTILSLAEEEIDEKYQPVVDFASICNQTNGGSDVDLS